MNRNKGANGYRSKKAALLVGLVLLAGCAGANQSARQDDFVEIPNPALTMSPGAPETIWVPRESVEKGPPRGRELAKKGYDAVRGVVKGAPAAQQPEAAPAAPAAPAVPAAAAPSAAPGAAPAAAAAMRLNDTAGNAAPLVAHFGLVVALEGERVYFNLGRQDGVAPGQKLKVYRGGTVVKGLGLAPGQTVGTLVVEGYVGQNGAYGVIVQGGAAQTNDLVSLE